MAVFTFLCLQTIASFLFMVCIFVFLCVGMKEKLFNLTLLNRIVGEFLVVLFIFGSLLTQITRI